MSDIAINVAYDLEDPGGPPIQNVDYAALVKTLRDARGLTQEEFARELDVTVGSMNGWENGKHRPVKAQRKRLLLIAQEAGITPPMMAPPEVAAPNQDRGNE